MRSRAGGIVADHDVPRADLLRLEVPAPRSRGRGATRGAVIGAIAAGAVGLGFGIAIARDDFFDVGAGGALAVGGIFGAAGAGAGALVGTAFPGTGWREVPLDGL